MAASEGHFAFVQEQHARQLDEIQDVLYGDKRLGATASGLVQNMQTAVKTAERNAERVAEIQATLKIMNNTLEHLKVQSDARQYEHDYKERNRTSRAASEIARILTVILFTTPILISDLRHVWLGDNPVTWFGVLALSIAASAGVAIVTRRNGH